VVVYVPGLLVEVGEWVEGQFGSKVISTLGHEVGLGLSLLDVSTRLWFLLEVDSGLTVATTMRGTDKP
jgi:hypothetical protein